MTSRAVALLIAAGIGVVLVLAYAWLRTRWGRGPERLDIDELGLELMTGCCAFVVFTTPACRPCKTALRIVSGAAERSRGLTEVTTVDAVERGDLSARYDVRTIPTVFLITASGHVLERWRGVPELADVEESLAAV